MTASLAARAGSLGSVCSWQTNEAYTRSVAS